MIVRRFGDRQRAGRAADDERGAVALVVAAFMVVIMGLAALVIDLGYARDRVRVAQNAADAAALAIATCFASPAAGCNTVASATAKAQGYITADGWTYDASTVSIDTAGQTATIRLPGQQSPGFFAGAIGGSTPAVGASAKATWRASGPLTCVLCVLQHYDGQTGDANLGGGMAVNGNIDFVGNGSITVTNPAITDPSRAIAVTGTFSTKGTYTVNGTATTPFALAPAFTDPFQSLALPPASSPGYAVDLTQPATRGGGANCAPGVYIDFSNCTGLSGNGVYIVTGDGGTRQDTVVQIPGTDVPNALIYLTCGTSSGPRNPIVTYRACTPTDHGASLGGAGRTNVTLHPVVNGPYAGFSVVYDRNRSATQKFTGQGHLDLYGTFYGAAVSGQFKGQGNGSFTGYGNMVIREVTFAGNHDHLDIPGNSVPVPIAAGTPVHLIP